MSDAISLCTSVCKRVFPLILISVSGLMLVAAPVWANENTEREKEPPSTSADETQAGDADTTSQASEGSTSAAQTTPRPLSTKEVQARDHFLRGVEFYRGGDLRPALLEFRRAYELSGNFRILYNVGQIYQELQMYSKAIEALEAYLARGGGEIDEARRSQVHLDLQRLREKVATVKVVVNVKGAEVVLDQVPLDAAMLGKPITLDAGEHVIEASRHGYETKRKAFTVVAKEQLSIELDLRRRKTLVKVVKQVESGPKEDQSRLPPLVWVGWGTTGVLAVGAGVTGALALSHANELANLRNSPDSTTADRDGEASQARAYGIASDALAAAAVTTGAISIVATLRTKRRNKRHTADVTLSPTGVTLKGTF